MELSDEDLVARTLAGGNSQAFGVLVQRYQSRLRGWLRQLTRDPAAADDISQETFLRAYEKLITFAGRGRFEAWLFKIGYTQFLQYQRKHKRMAGFMTTWAAEPAVGPEQSAPDSGQQAADQNDLAALLMTLGSQERDTLILFYAYGFTHQEISAVTDTPVGTVKSNIHRGKARIRERFALPQAC